MNGENLTAKTPLGDFGSPLSKLYYYHNKRLQVKESQVPYQPIVEPLPNTQLDLFCSDNFSFRCMTPKYVTNQLHGSQYATSITNYRKSLAAKFFSSSQR